MHDQCRLINSLLIILQEDLYTKSSLIIYMTIISIIYIMTYRILLKYQCIVTYISDVFSVTTCISTADGVM